MDTIAAQRPTPIDSFPTETSKTQAETEAVLLTHAPDRTNPDKQTPPPKLDKNAHVQFLARNLLQGFPSRYTGQDASQPWLMYFTIHGFALLQVGLDPGNRQRAVEKILLWQHPEGGFGGGPGQAPHLLATYSSVCSLAVAGGPTVGWDKIDREKMYKWFMSLKQKDGSFLVSHHSEVDVRGIYCLLVVATLLNIVTPELVEGTAEFIASCQTYEGGFSSASHPSYALEGGLFPSRSTLGEAHGGYTFCALASWVLLQPYISTLPAEKPKPQINLGNLLRWLVQMQGIEIELGGFKGRTNKLVDGCYAWWCGGAFGLLEALGVGGIQNAESEDVPIDTSDDPWDDIDEGLFNNKALQEYILYAGQHPAGGLRDKPPKGADAYHTLYCLAGLSAAQHHVYPSAFRKNQVDQVWKATESEHDDLKRQVFSEILSWREEEGACKALGGTENRLNATHPVVNLTMTHTDAICEYFYQQQVPSRLAKKPSNAKA